MNWTEFWVGMAMATVLLSAVQAHFSRGLKASQEAHTEALKENAAANREYAAELRKASERLGEP